MSYRETRPEKEDEQNDYFTFDTFNDVIKRIEHMRDLWRIMAEIESELKELGAEFEITIKHK